MITRSLLIWFELQIHFDLEHPLLLCEVPAVKEDALGTRSIDL